MPECVQCGREMKHVTGVVDFHDPGDPHGHGQRETCGYECECGEVDDCDRSHHHDEE